MIISLVHRDLRGRYKGTVLGFAWTFINPLLQLMVYTFVFSTVMRSGIKDYYLFLFVALIPWIFFNTSVSAGCMCTISQQDMVKKIYFPREVLPISFVISQLINMLLSFIVVFIVLIVSGKGLNPLALVFLPYVVIVEFMMSLGMCMLFSAITVYVRDLGYLMGNIMMMWQFLSPVMYSMDQVPEKARMILQYNPMTPVIEAYRTILYYKKIPELNTLLTAVVFGIIMLIIGFFSFDRLQRKFADRL